jgi:uroporphyrinogen decarboxylase
MSETRLARGVQVGAIYGFVEMSMGYEEMCLALYDDPGLVREAAATGAEHVIEMTRRLIDLVEPDFIVLNDDIAFKTGPMISPSAFRDIFLEHFLRLGQLLRERDVTYVCHTDGDFVSLLQMFLEAGIMAVHPCEAAAVDIAALKQRCGDHLCTIGNLDVDLLIRGRPTAVYGAARDLLLGVGRQNGYIFSSGNIIPRETPQENLEAMIAAYQEYAGRAEEPVCGAIDGPAQTEP